MSILFVFLNKCGLYPLGLRFILQAVFSTGMKRLVVFFWLLVGMGINKCVRHLHSHLSFLYPVMAERFHTQRSSCSL